MWWRLARRLFFLCVVCTFFWHLLLDRQRSSGTLPLPFGITTSSLHLPTVNAAPGREQIFFAPTDNLEQIDIELIDGAHSSIRIAMYAFTDRTIAQALSRAAARGVDVEIYRDRAQFEEEQAHRSLVASILAGQRSIHIRVKGSGELMHEKAMLIDETALRDGSGNWSISAARYQDNQVSITGNSQQIEAFARNFTSMWERSDNLAVQ